MKNNHTPEIRFSGFTGNWVEYKFEDMYDVVSGYAFKMSDYVQGGVPIINGESIQHGSISTKNLNFLPEGFSDKYQNFILDNGDIVLGLNRPITNGKLKIAQVPKDLHGALLYQRAGKIIILNNSNINFSYQLLGNEVSKFVLKEAVGSDQPFISTTKLKKWLICIPALEEEQTKIGNFLKQLDDTIALHQQELTTLKQTKQGFLQKMFPKEGESVPDVRFSGFTGDWKLSKIGDLLSSLKSGLSRMLSNQDIGLPVIRANNINNGILDIDNDIKYWYVDDPQGANTQNYLIHKNDILVNFINSEAKMGTAAIVGSEPKRPTIYTTNILNLRTNQDANPYFIYSLTMTERYKNYIKTITKPAVNQASFTTVDFKKYEFLAPTIKEQIKIGEFFKQLDDTIALHQRELDALKETKKAFLQKMFA